MACRRLADWHGPTLGTAYLQPERRQAGTGDALQLLEAALQMHRNVVQHGVDHAQRELRILLRTRVRAKTMSTVTAIGLREGSMSSQLLSI